MAKIIDGKQIAAGIYAELSSDIQNLWASGCNPSLVVVLVGDNPASQVYVRMKTKAAAALGMLSDTRSYPESLSMAELLDIVHELNAQPAVHGILVQLPLPSHIDENTILNAVSPAKDVDGFHPNNRGKLVLGEDTFVPCTPLGVQQMLVRSGIEIPGKHVVIVGRSKIVGLPLAMMLALKGPAANATVTICHTGTQGLDNHTKNADILVVAAGRPGVIDGSMIKPGAVVVDVGVNRVQDANTEKGYRLVGDVDFASASKVASAITPVPGGVGPMTIAMLMYNTVKAAKMSR